MGSGCVDRRGVKVELDGPVPLRRGGGEAVVESEAVAQVGEGALAGVAAALRQAEWRQEAQQ